MERTTIISDLHLGSDVCQAKDLCDFLEDIDDRSVRLILNGDVFDSMDFRRLKKHHWHVLSRLRKVSDHMEVVWVCGNHDGTADVVSHLLGITVVDQYIFPSGDNKILALHGHIFDDFIDKHPILTAIGDFIYWGLQKLDRTHFFARLAKRNSKTYLRCADIIKAGAKKLAAKVGCQVVCCGHTHHALEDLDGEVAYYNSGCWTELPCHYLEVEDGKVALQSYVTRRDSGPGTEPCSSPCS
jgi:UDP-2,3-diacylglucosamine pyrophosphatase LpxH